LRGRSAFRRDSDCGKNAGHQAFNQRSSVSMICLAWSRLEMLNLLCWRYSPPRFW